MSRIKKVVDALKTIPKTVWVATIVPGGFIYIGIWATKIVYKKINK